MAMEYDAIVVGSGPNGLAAAIELARAGCSVRVFEARDSVGGGTRSAELTLPGFVHDVCSAIHPLGVGSPFFQSLPLSSHGLEWIQPDSPVAHPLSGGGAILLDRNVKETAGTLGVDSAEYQKVIGGFVRRWETLVPELLAPIHFPAHPLLLARFGRYGLMSARSFASRVFKGEHARALFAGMAAHSILSPDHRPGASFGLVLNVLAHAVGWPLPKGGSQQIANALAGYLQSLGGVISTGTEIRSLDELPTSRVLLCDITPRQLARLAGRRLPDRFRQRLDQYRYGPGVFKVDWALSAPIPWKNSKCSRAATVHLGGTFETIQSSERDVARGLHPGRPFVILTQPSLFDRTRTPEGGHTAWAYCHVPNGSSLDMTSRIESQIEEVAPGFRDCVAARHTLTTGQLETYNPNYVGGDINGGAQNLLQMMPYRTPVKGLYLCSSSTRPGGGVHGMCGFHAARKALEDLGIPAYNQPK
jgi:phytoene dehydrogenase-like protein